MSRGQVLEKAPIGLGRTIAIVRVIRGMRQKDLANALGVDASHVSMLENGKREPSFGLVKRLAEALRIRPWKLHALAERSQGQWLDEKGAGP